MLYNVQQIFVGTVILMYICSLILGENVIDDFFWFRFFLLYD